MGIVGVGLVVLGLVKRGHAQREQASTTEWTALTVVGCTFMIPALLLLGYAGYFIFLLMTKKGPLL